MSILQNNKNLRRFQVKACEEKNDRISENGRKGETMRGHNKDGVFNVGKEMERYEREKKR